MPRRTTHWRAWSVLALAALAALSAVACRTSSETATPASPTATSPTPAASTSTPSPAASPTQSPFPHPSDRSLCRGGDVLAGVYNPSRLQLIDPCVAATGTVARVRKEPDGDYHVNISPDPDYLLLLSDGNNKNAGGKLIVEVIPDDQDIVAIPKEGAHITVVGAYVDDTNHNWREIHPAWLIGPAGSVAVDLGVTR